MAPANPNRSGCAKESELTLSRSRAGLDVREDSSKSLLSSRAAGPVWMCESAVANREKIV